MGSPSSGYSLNGRSRAYNGQLPRRDEAPMLPTVLFIAQIGPVPPSMAIIVSSIFMTILSRLTLPNYKALSTVPHQARPPSGFRAMWSKAAELSTMRRVIHTLCG